jgi:hypothetical protein
LESFAELAAVITPRVQSGGRLAVVYSQAIQVSEEIADKVE